MRQGQVDLCIVGTDRTTAGGDVANKIGTYLKALAAHDNDIPFYVALPSPTIDWQIESGAAIPIERRDSREVTHLEGWTEDGAAGRGAPDPGGQPRRELCLRRDAGAARHRADHRARRLSGLRGPGFYRCFRSITSELTDAIAKGELPDGRHQGDRSRHRRCP